MNWSDEERSALALIVVTAFYIGHRLGRRAERKDLLRRIICAQRINEHTQEQ